MINTAFSFIDNFLSGMIPIFKNILDVLYACTIIFLGLKLCINALYVFLPIQGYFSEDSRFKKLFINKNLDTALQNQETNILPIFLKNCVLVQGSVIVALLLFKFLIFGGVRL